MEEEQFTLLIKRAEETGESLDELVRLWRQAARKRLAVSSVKPDQRPK